MSNNANFHTLLNHIEEVKEKLTDNQYKTILEEISSLNNKYNNLKDAKRMMYLNYNTKNEELKHSFNRLKDNYISLSIKHFNLQLLCDTCSISHEDVEDSESDE